jgi:predicted nucleic acid-binding protein
MYTLDSNILVYAADEDSEFHERAKHIRDQAAEDAHACLCFPVLLEFFAQATYPRLGKALAPQEAWREVESYVKTFRILFPKRSTLQHLGRLVKSYNVSRQDIFDALIVALMKGNGVNGIYTANEKDFRKFKGIQVLAW